MEASKLAGGKLGRILFTNDSKFFFCATGKHIKVYSVITGQVVRTLSSDNDAHSKKITCLSLNPFNHLQLYSASLDGTVRLWEFNDGVMLKKWEVGAPINHLNFKAQDSDSLYLTITPSTKKSDNLTHFIKFNLKSSKHQLLMKCGKGCLGVDISKNGDFLVAVSKMRIYVYDFNTMQRKKHKLETEATSMMIHPTEPCIAIGDKVGKINFWYCFEKEQRSNPVTTSLHWHAHAVNCLAFTSADYLLSGGEEGVLVVWQLETEHKDFLPRLASDILSIAVSPDQTLYALVHKDNTIRIVSATNMKIKQEIVGLKCAQLNHVKYPLSTGIVVDPKTNNIVLNGTPGTLQFYNPFTDRHVQQLSVTPRNRISRRDVKEISYAHVNRVCISENSEWMMSVDVREEEEVFLKFWEYDNASRGYVVNTRIDLPHTDEITAVEFCPVVVGQPLIAVTTSLDGKFKIWQLNKSEKVETHWSCRSVGYYKESAAHNASFSSDGSILAVSYGQVVTLWDPYSNSLHAVLTYPPSALHPIIQIEFLKKSPHLVARSDSHVYVWDLMTCQVVWSKNIYAKSLCVDPNSSLFVIISNTTSSVTTTKAGSTVSIYSPTSPNPNQTHRMSSKIVAATLISKNNVSTTGVETENLFDRSKILIMNSSYEVLVLDDANAVDENVDIKNQTSVKSNPKTLFSDIYGKINPQSQIIQQTKPKNVKNLQKASNVPLFEIPSNVLPSPSAFAATFLDSLLDKIKEQQEQAPEKEETDAMVIDEVVEGKTPAAIVNDEQVDGLNAINSCKSDRLKKLLNECF